MKFKVFLLNFKHFTFFLTLKIHRISKIQISSKSNLRTKNENSAQCVIKSGFCISRNCVENANPILSNRVEMQNFFFLNFFQLWNSSGVRLKKVGEWPCSTSSVSIMAEQLQFYTHCSKSSFFVQKFNFDQNPNISTSFSPQIFFDNFSREIKVVNS